MVWLDQQSPHRGASRSLGRCPGSRGAKADRRRYPASVLDRRAAFAAWALVSADGVAEHDRRDSRWIPIVLGRAAGLMLVTGSASLSMADRAAGIGHKMSDGGN